MCQVLNAYLLYLNKLYLHIEYSNPFIVDSTL